MKSLIEQLCDAVSEHRTACAKHSKAGAGLGEVQRGERNIISIAHRIADAHNARTARERTTLKVIHEAFEGMEIQLGKHTKIVISDVQGENPKEDEPSEGFDAEKLLCDVGVYPDPERLRTWPADDPKRWLWYARHCWEKSGGSVHHGIDDAGNPDYETFVFSFYEISKVKTVLDAMKENSALWDACWRREGGCYVTFSATQEKPDLLPLLSEFSEIDRMLQETPESDVIDRESLKGRRREVMRRIDALYSKDSEEPK